MKNNIIFFIFVFCLTISCSDENFGDFFVSKTRYYFEATEKEIRVELTEKDFSILVKTNMNTEWYAETKDEWIELIDKNGVSSGKISFKVKNNIASSSRNGTISLYGMGRHLDDISISQLGSTTSVLTKELEFSSIHSSYELDILSNNDWEIVCNAKWVSFSEKYGSGNSNVKIFVEENQSTIGRSSDIEIIDLSNNIINVTISQKGKFLNIETNLITVPAGNASFKEGISSPHFLYETDGNLKITISEGGWFEIFQNEESFSVVNCTRNLTEGERTGKLLLSLENIDDFEPIEVIVKQDCFVNGHEVIDLGLSAKWSADYLTFNYSLSNISSDAVSNKWGSPWSFPTPTSMEELLNECIWTWLPEGEKVDENGYTYSGSGYIVKSKVNKRVLFLKDNSTTYTEYGKHYYVNFFVFRFYEYNEIENWWIPDVYLLFGDEKEVDFSKIMGNEDKSVTTRPIIY